MRGIGAMLTCGLVVMTITSALAGCKSAANVTPDLSQPGADDMGDVDAGLPTTEPAAAVWTSCGGGSGAGDVTASQLNFTIGDTTVVGVSPAAGGASVSFSYFSDDNH